VRLGVCDEIIQEAPGGAHRDPAVTANGMRRVLKRHLAELSRMAPDDLVEQRYRKFRAMGAMVEGEPADYPSSSR
jgi:acetyl-CoA carboxylase carboxyl transferase subunit alpha